LILVISNIADEAAPVLVDMFPPGTASLVTASGLHDSFKAAIALDDFGSAELTINKLRIPAREILGVVTMVPYFLSQEFYHVAQADREYVCAEVNAFFIFFLSRLACKKINPPSRRTLTGLGVHKIEWSETLCKMGVPLWPFGLKNGMAATSETEPAHHINSTMIGDVFLGDDPPEKVATGMRQIAQVFALPYVSCSFFSPDKEDFFLAELRSVVDISTPGNREAVVRYFRN
jgi:hypothetical protein